MKNSFFLLLSLVAVTSCQVEKTDGYTITGTIQGLEDGTAVLMNLEAPEYFLGKQKKVIDTAYVTNGSFTFSGKVAAPQLHKLTIDNPKKERLQKQVVPVFVENTDIQISGNLENIPTLLDLFDAKYDFGAVTVSGSVSNDLYKDFKQKYNLIRQEENKLWEENKKNFKEKRKLSIAEGIDLATRFENNNVKKQDFLYGYIENHLDTDVGKYIVYKSIAYQEAKFSKMKLEEILNTLSVKNDSSLAFSILEESVANAIRIAPGSEYIDLTLKDTQDNNVKLSDHLGKGNYVLLEFWASWCGPCRLDIPHLKDVYELYKDTGFDIISVSMDDNKEAWLKAVEEEQMPWLQISDGMAFEGQLSKQYSILGIPACFLIGPNGKIVTDNFRGSYMDKRLIAMYGNRFEE